MADAADGEGGGNLEGKRFPFASWSWRGADGGPSPVGTFSFGLGPLHGMFWLSKEELLRKEKEAGATWDGLVAPSPSTDLDRPACLLAQMVLQRIACSLVASHKQSGNYNPCIPLRCFAEAQCGSRFRRPDPIHSKHRRPELGAWGLCETTIWSFALPDVDFHCQICLLTSSGALLPTAESAQLVEWCSKDRAFEHKPVPRR